MAAGISRTSPRFGSPMAPRFMLPPPLLPPSSAACRAQAAAAAVPKPQRHVSPTFFFAFWPPCPLWTGHHLGLQHRNHANHPTRFFVMLIISNTCSSMRRSNSPCLLSRCHTLMQKHLKKLISLKHCVCGPLAATFAAPASAPEPPGDAGHQHVHRTVPRSHQVLCPLSQRLSAWDFCVWFAELLRPCVCS